MDAPLIPPPAVVFLPSGSSPSSCSSSSSSSSSIIITNSPHHTHPQRRRIKTSSFHLAGLVLLTALFVLLTSSTVSANGGSGLISPLTSFDAKGQLPQSEAAARAVARGGTVIALSTKDAVLLVAPRQDRAKSLVEGRGLPKMWRLTNRICLSHAGLMQDSRTLLLAAQQTALEHENKFGESIPVGELVEMVAGKQQEATMQGSKRPFGSSILVAGLISSSSSSSNGNNGSSNGKGNKRKGSSSGSNFFYPRIYRTDPSGSYSLWKACAIGQGSEKVMALLEDKYHDQMTTKEALELALECCRIFDKDLKSSTITTPDEDQEKKGGNEEDSNEKVSVGVKTVVDAALVSSKGTMLYEGLSPEKLAADIDT